MLESVRPRDYEIGPWLAQFIASHGCTIDAKALAMLTDHLGTDIAKISNELGKLLLSLPEGTKRITDATSSRTSASRRISTTSNSARPWHAQTWLERALRIADHFARNPKDNPLLVTDHWPFQAVPRHLRVNYLRWLSRHKGARFPRTRSSCASSRRATSTLWANSSRPPHAWDNRRVFHILGLLREYDAKAKGMNAGGAPDGELLRELLLKIFLQ